MSKAQAKLLAEGFLDTLGSGKEGLQPRETITEVFLLAGELIEDAQKNLNSSNKVATGKLSQSLVADEPVATGRTLRVDVLMNFYGAFVNKGVKGTRGGSSRAGYSFKNDFPSENMVKAIQEWIDNAKISTANVKQYKGHGRHEKKQKTISQLDHAYAVSRGIKMGGLKPTGFMDKAVLTTRNKVAQRLSKALAIDIIDGLK